MKFYQCKHCGNLVAMVNDAGVPMVCCGEAMTLLKANSTEAATEKHIPVYTVDGDVLTVEVGSIAHPMTEEHHIAWIYVETENGGMLRNLNHTSPAKATFNLNGEKIKSIYAYCNLHGLWAK